MEVFIDGVRYIRPDQDVMVNDYITVLEWTSHRDNSYVSDVLEVKAVDLPFVVVNRKSKYRNNEDIIKLDLRRVLIKQLSNDYVLEYLKKY